MSQTMTQTKSLRGEHDTDPLTTTSAYPLSVNNLEKLMDFVHTPAGLCVVSKVSLPAGAHFTYLTAHVPQQKKSWKTIQTSTSTQTDPQSALLYMNHSCAPSIEVHTFSPNELGEYPRVPPGGNRNGEIIGINAYGIAGEVRVARDRGIEPGDALTFFYPSTEWSMDRPFDCLCGAGEGKCLGVVSGASSIDSKTMQRWYFNDHIHELARQRDVSQ